MLKKTLPSKDWTSKLERITTRIEGQTSFDKAQEADRYLYGTNEENKLEAVTICICCHCMEGAIEANSAPGVLSLNIECP